MSSLLVIGCITLMVGCVVGCVLVEGCGEEDTVGVVGGCGEAETAGVVDEGWTFRSAFLDFRIALFSKFILRFNLFTSLRSSLGSALWRSLSTAPQSSLLRFKGDPSDFNRCCRIKSSFAHFRMRILASSEKPRLILYCVIKQNKSCSYVYWGNSAC